MPEGPEVKRNAVALAEAISGNTLNSVNVISGRYTKKPVSDLENYRVNLPDKVLGVGVHGKFIYILCSSGWNIWSTLGMTGYWSKNRTKHSRVAIELEHNQPVFFNDIRNFGTFKLVYGKDSLIKKLESLGPDLLDPEIELSSVVKSLRKKNSWNICKALMNQQVIAGVGNYIKAEALWKSKISPHRIVKDLEDYELIELCDAAIQIMKSSYDSGGASFMTHKNFDGEEGTYATGFLCYGRKIDALGNEVIKIKTPDGRKTHWSPRRQK